MISSQGGPPWSTLAAVAAAGVLLLAFFVARSGSSVALTGALVVAALLVASAVAAAVARRRQAAARTIGLDVPALAPELPAGGQPAAGALAAAVALARTAVSELHAPAASVLVPRGGRLASAGSAGDWALARRIHSERERPDVGRTAVRGDESDAPPEFRLDPRNDWLPRVLALYGQPIPLERWRETGDAPVALLPLAALGTSGAGVAVPLTYRRRLTGLLVVGQRANNRLYSDAELAALHRLARSAGHALGAALG